MSLALLITHEANFPLILTLGFIIIYNLEYHNKGLTFNIQVTGGHPWQIYKLYVHYFTSTLYEVKENTKQMKL